MTNAEIELAFASLSEEYDSLKVSTECRVKFWRWSTSPWFDPRPLHFERMGHAAGRQLRTEPANRVGRVCCGFDEQSRVVIERNFNELGYYETFFNWTTESVEAAHYDYSPEKKPINRLSVTLVDNRAISSVRSAIHGFIRELYEWRGSLLISVFREQAKREDGHIGRFTPLHATAIDYDDNGVLSRIVDRWPKSAEIGSTEITELVFERRGGKIYRRRP